MQLKAFYDKTTYTLSYLVWHPETRDAIVIDPVLNYDVLTSQTTLESINQISHFVTRKNLRLHWVLETHAHADHLTGAQLLKHRFDATVAIGNQITVVQYTFKSLLDLPDSFRCDGSQFDKLIEDNEILSAGMLKITALATPGHTPACMSYLIEDSVFTGDTLFMHDYGTGRTDFPKGSASDLYRSVHDRLYALPDTTRVFVGHDYQPQGRELCYETTIGLSKQKNPQLHWKTKQEEFVTFRTQRDATLKQPQLLFQSIQTNINAGRLPEVHPNGNRYFLIPVNLSTPTDDIGRPV